MMQLDAYSQWMGIRVLHIDFGTCTLSCTISPEMLNGFGITHGGISYALADSALAFASNSHGQQCVSIETSIAHIKPAQLNDTLTAICTEIQKGKTIARYVVEITNQHNELIARFNGTVFRSEKTW
ncbi:MAG: thioesterase [Candidatus Fluviicola riflensis]|nr:MAG: thioesterase [Candidatus Fluviicola riflensis]OGS76905.1 MAG: thioesterase [Candidatus Fluviicola riflensis]OGS81834.1 MAG: thioesterase [Fluviicola sp. RIFCSPHIGHO2_01_FULL_43_53]OGS88634.1 MAG: thioesterase [Fluviicola sp. RIFCSPHIGHO2_12_FULL_43_24]